MKRDQALNKLATLTAELKDCLKMIDELMVDGGKRCAAEWRTVTAFLSSIFRVAEAYAADKPFWTENSPLQRWWEMFATDDDNPDRDFALAAHCHCPQCQQTFCLDIARYAAIYAELDETAAKEEALAQAFDLVADHAMHHAKRSGGKR